MCAALAALGPLAQLIPHKEFTAVQEATIPALLASKDNAVVAAPTGSGKTLLLEVVMLQLFSDRLLKTEIDVQRSRSGHSGVVPDCTPPSEGMRVVYVCPIKALASEKHTHWTTMFAPLMVVIETGDQGQGRTTGMDDHEQLGAVLSADIIITTPERWDSITRRWKEKTILDLVNTIGLLLLDEIHTVHEERGAALEAIVSRMKAITAARLHHEHPQQPKRSTTMCARIVAISGTLPNVEDFAEWLSVPPQMVFSFSAADRPVPLTLHVQGYPSSSSNPFAFYRFLSFKLFGLIRAYGGGKPTLVFCASRKETEASAQRLVEDIRSAAERERKMEQLQPSEEVQRLSNQATDRTLRGCLLIGVGFHHAAMGMKDRQLVEKMFREQYIAVVCTTSTLALGVNLPAHLVIVKGTSMYKNGKKEDLPLSEITQMCGRAGRPGFDDHGIALILTTQDKVPMYQPLTHGGDVHTTVESKLHCHMIEHVNAEVALRTIDSFASGVEWVKTTFFWVRLMRRPQYYGLQFSTREDERVFDPHKYVARLMQRVLLALRDVGCIAVHSVSCDALVEGAVEDACQCSSTRIGRSMARLYILFDTVKTFETEARRRRHRAGVASSVAATDPTRTQGTDNVEDEEGGDDETDDGAANDNDSTEAADSSKLSRVGEVASLKRIPFKLQDALALLCQGEELAEVRLRQGDKGPLNEVNKSLRYPLKSGKKGGREVREDWHKAYVLVQAQLAHLPISDISLRNDSLRLWAVVPRVCRFLCDFAWASASYSFSLHADMLLRCVEQRLWPDGPLLLRQLNGVTDAMSRTLAVGGCGTFAALRESNPRRLEAICNRLPPFGTRLQRQLDRLPQCCLSVAATVADPHQIEVPRPSATPVRTLTHWTVSVRAAEEAVPSMDMYGADAEADAVVSPVTGKSGGGQHKARFGGMLLLVGHSPSDSILLQRYIHPAAVARMAHDRSPLTYTFSVSPSVTGSLTAHLITAHWLGNDVTETVPLSVASTQPAQAAADSPSSAHTEPQGTHSIGGRNCKRERAVTAPATPATPGDIACQASESYAALLSDLRWIDEGRDSPRRQRGRHCEPPLPQQAMAAYTEKAGPVVIYADAGLPAPLECSTNNTVRVAVHGGPSMHPQHSPPPAAGGGDGEPETSDRIAAEPAALNRVVLRACESPEPEAVLPSAPSIDTWAAVLRPPADGTSLLYHNAVASAVDRSVVKEQLRHPPTMRSVGPYQFEVVATPTQRPMRPSIRHDVVTTYVRRHSGAVPAPPTDYNVLRGPPARPFCYPAPFALGAVGENDSDFRGGGPRGSYGYEAYRWGRGGGGVVSAGMQGQPVAAMPAYWTHGSGRFCSDNWGYDYRDVSAMPPWEGEAMYPACTSINAAGHEGVYSRRSGGYAAAYSSAPSYFPTDPYPSPACATHEESVRAPLSHPPRASSTIASIPSRYGDATNRYQTHPPFHYREDHFAEWPQPSATCRTTPQAANHNGYNNASWGHRRSTNYPTERSWW